MYKILIIEDDPAIADVERDYLEIEGYEVETAEDGISGLNRGLSGEFDLIVLDLMLPGMDGFSVCKRLREKLNIPIIMVTARHEDIDQVRGLGLGADAYILKPFSPSVLIAHIKTNLARHKRLTDAPEDEEELTFGNLHINIKSRRVFVNDNEVYLKNKEYELLLFLMDNADIVFSKDTLYEKIWGMDAIGDNATVAVHINRIRDKIEEDPARPIYIETVRGAGYRFNK